jgi:hypothetical protein
VSSTITVDLAALETVIAEAIMLAAWNAKLKGTPDLWAGQPPTPAGLDWAMRKVRLLAEGER